MAQISFHRRRLRPIDLELRAIGLLAAIIVLAAALAGFGWMRAAGRRGGGRSGEEAVGATLTEMGRHRLVVDSIRGDGMAMRAGLRVGDLVEAVDGKPTPTVSAADHALLARRVDIRIRRGMRIIDLHLDTTGGARVGQQNPADRG